jgi:membrane fusion protein (multidrug efflux system)
MKYLRTSLWIIGFVAVVALLLYIRKPAQQGNTPAPATGKAGVPPKPQPIRVSAYVVKNTSLTNKIKVVGTILANEEILLRSEVSGRIIKLNFKEGTPVSKGQLLLKINDADLQAQLKKVKSQNKLAQDNEKRLKLLLQKEGISQADHEIAVNQLNVSEAEIEALSAQIEKTEIRAPFSGIIGLRQISEGAYITPQSNIAMLQDASQVKIEFAIPERYATQIRTGSSIEFSVENSIEKYAAQVYAMEPKIDLNTRNLTLRAVCNNAGKQLFTGSFAEIEITLDKNEQAFLLPSEAIVPQLKGKAVYLVRNGKAVLQPVKTGTRLDKDVQVLDGVQLGDTIATSGTLQLRPDAPVVVIK